MSKVKVSMNLTEQDVDTLKKLALKYGISMTEAIRRALATEKFLEDAKDDGSQILIRDKEKNFRQLVLR